MIKETIVVEGKDDIANVKRAVDAEMVATNGLLGEKYLKVVPGGGVNYLKRGDVVSNTQGTMDLEDLISKFITGGAGKSTSSSSTESSASQPATDDAEPSFVE
mgnify:CR=1 FL=1